MVDRLGRPAVRPTPAMVTYVQNQFTKFINESMKHKSLSALGARKTVSACRLPVPESLIKTKGVQKTMKRLKTIREASLNCEKNRLIARCKSLFGQRTGH